MPVQRVPRLAFNRGKISRLGLGRVDVERAELSAETQTNWMPRVLGSMMLRPGTKFIGSTKSDAASQFIPFVKSTDDTALIEFTNTTMRVWDGDTLVSRTAVSTGVVNGAFTDGAEASFSKLSDLTGLAAGTVNTVAFSNDGQLYGSGNSTGPALEFYTISGTTFTASQDFAPGGGVFNIAFNPDTSIVSVAHGSSPFITNYPITGTTVGSALSNPASLPPAQANGVAWSADGTFLAVTHNTTPFVTVYSYTAPSTFTKITTGDTSEFADSADLPTGNGQAVSWSEDGSFLAVAHTTTPFVSIYSVSGTGTSATFTKLTNPGTLPAGNGTGVKFSRDGEWLAVSHATTPFVTIYSISGTTFTKAANPATLPAGNAEYVDISSDNQFIAVAHATTPFITIYQNLSGTWTKISDPGTLPDGNATSVAFSLHNRFLAVGHATSQFHTIYSPYNWLDLDGSGASSSLTNNRLQLTGNKFTEARRIQAVIVNNTDKAVEHALNLEVTTGPIKLRVGTSYNDDDLINETTLYDGHHSISFTPNSNVFFIQISSDVTFITIIDNIAIDGSGTMEITSPYTTADLPNIRYAQSGDVIFLACKDVQQYRIERRNANGWSLVKYLADDGPFRNINTSFVTLTPSALDGTITLTASQPIFKSGHLGALFKVSSIGQTVDLDATGANQFSDDIRVSGTGTTRAFTITRAGTWSATVTLQRSISEPGSWTDVATFTTNGTATYDDGLDNQIIYYRIGIKTGDYTSGTAELTLAYGSGSLDGILRVSQVSSPTIVAGQTLKPFGAATASLDWQESVWSTLRGWPSSVALYEGRLAWAGNDYIILSESDNFHNFDQTVEGDAGPIIRTIGEGPVDNIHWLLPLQRLIAGAEGSEFSIRSNSFDEPLTPSNYNMKSCSTQGSAPVAAVRIDSNGAFVERSGTRLYQLLYNFDTYDYASSDLTRLVPDMCEAGIKKIVLQRHPDTRIHCVLDDGTVAVCIFEPDEDVICWVDITTDGLIEDAVVLPQEVVEDAVYYVVNRTINGVTKRYLEKWALESECVGGTLNKNIDCFLEYSGAGTTTITGLSHLEGETVVVWGNGKDLGTKVVSGGQITGLSESVTSAVVGLSYTAQYKSCKLAYAAANGTALSARKILHSVGIIAADMHHEGLEYGSDFNYLRPLPSVYRNQDVVADTVHTEYDDDLVPVNKEWGTDTRLCLQATSPRPCTLLAVTMVIETNG